MLSKASQKYFSQLLKLPRDQNQARLLGEYALNFLKNGNPSQKVYERVKLFHTDSVFTGISALALKTNAPTILKAEALENAQKVGTKPKIGFSRCFGSNLNVPVEKAVCANAAAVREWDSNGTVFGFNETVNANRAGEFGHNDFYPAVLAAAHQNPDINGKLATKAMILQDEIRGRLCESFSLKTYKIDHVVHGAVATICTYGALMNANPLQIEHAIGMFLAHYIPFRAIRAGKQLSDSKGASAALSTEAALMCIKRAMNGFIGPKDIFRNPEAIFRLNEPTKNGDSPFDIYVSNSGDDFAVMGMHFKLGLYEHQSAGALEGLQKLILENKFLEHNNANIISKIKIIAYEPAFGIIGDASKRRPKSRQSADHSMVYIVSTMLRKAIEDKSLSNVSSLDEVWKKLILLPEDYSYKAIQNPVTLNLIDKTEFEHGGKEYDEKYPEGIPTSIQITLKNGKILDSKFIMFPSGHAKNKTCDLRGILENKFQILGKLAISENEIQPMIQKLMNLDNLSNADLQQLYNCNIKYSEKSIDDVNY
ncbi:hypothetical protein IMG5_076500 [Ichthyophthirius multifiliis]|uniref:MmgE/PrpD N-terminal domain-containing protein n=1 Tax=Ichthyophthirius multifiliis TaxID=5932 RepID=G0QQB9_ICHMU|nr:hypothetical protein IMG5_076500 [Ichthyophthirius multifiliis]EGR32620.1 hypothetical protein IMG5_076500 [Ichthyophthirius multifiliis]|eukprot:XP_004036606.1 hypothetical protein IMG5_076500 [Ichthyophthirius multifiliis]